MIQFENIYAKTAYDSRKPRALPPEPERDEGFLMRTARGQRIHLPVGPQCREYKGFSIHAQDEALEPVNIEKYDRENRGPHRMQSWPDLLEWTVFRRSLQYVIAWFAMPAQGECLARARVWDERVDNWLPTPDEEDPFHEFIGGWASSETLKI